jgi:hypothetical protein
MTDTPLDTASPLPESRGRQRRPIAKLMLAMLAAKIAYDVVMRRWAATISKADKT